MKKITFILSCLLLFGSCSKDEAEAAFNNLEEGTMAATINGKAIEFTPEGVIAFYYESETYGSSIFGINSVAYDFSQGSATYISISMANEDGPIELSGNPTFNASTYELTIGYINAIGFESEDEGTVAYSEQTANLIITAFNAEAATISGEFSAQVVNEDDPSKTYTLNGKFNQLPVAETVIGF